MRRLAWVGAIATCVGFILGFATSPSEAYVWGQLSHNCQTFDVSYEFVDTTPPNFDNWQSLTQYSWTTSNKNHVNSGGDQWDKVTEADGTGITSTSNPSSGPYAYRAFRLEHNVNGFAGWHVCDATHGALLSFDFTDENGDPYNAKIQKGLAVHEIGHALGLGHVSIHDNLWAPNHNPSMAADSDKTLDQPEKQQSIEIDDWGHLQKQFDQENGNSALYLSGNGSFENGNANGFSKSTGTTVSWHAIGGKEGASHGRITASSGNPTAWHTTRVWRDTVNGITDVDASVWVKMNIAPALLSEDTYDVKLRSRSVGITTCSEGGGNWPQVYLNPNINCPTNPDAYVVRDEDTFVAGQSWQWANTLSWNPNNSWVGADIQIRIVNNLKDLSDDPVELWVDVATIREQ